MNKFLLSVHVVAAIIFVGPVTVAASMFPPIARRALTAVLAFVVLPGQGRVLSAAGGPPDERAVAQARSLSMTTGIFALLWVTVTVLMIIRPGSTTGV